MKRIALILSLLFGCVLWFFASILFTRSCSAMAQPAFPKTTNAPYDLHLAFTPSAGAEGHWLLVNGAKTFPSIGTNVYATNLSVFPSPVRLSVIGTNGESESAESNSVMVTNRAPLTNRWIVVTSVLVLTNPPGTMFFALCAATNLGGVWRPATQASNAIRLTHY